MTRKSKVKAVVAAIEKRYARWQRQMDLFAAGERADAPTLGKEIQDQLLSLRGMSTSKAQEYEWMLAL